MCAFTERKFLWMNSAVFLILIRFAIQPSAGSSRWAALKCNKMGGIAPYLRPGSGLMHLFQFTPIFRLQENLHALDFS